MMEEKKYSQFRAMLAIARGSLRSILRSPSAVVFTIAFPMVFIIAFGGMSGGSITLNVGFYDKSDTGTFIYQQLKNIPNIKIINDKSQDEMIDLLQRGKLDALLKIEKDPASNRNEIVTF